MMKPSWYKGWKKQVVDQAGHSIWAWGTVYVYRFYPELAAVSFGYWCGREQQQGESSRRFDPHLDWIFFLTNIALATRWI